MRPLSLEISGFRSHLDPTELSFEERSLTAIVGPTGSGKSSILEAISYALYGKTPREQRAVKRLICSRTDTARVEFRFLVDQKEYKILRVLRRSGAGQHILEDLSSGDKVSGETTVTSRVIELLGLGFDAFSSSVLLAQGEFAKFLQATPSERSGILKGIFRLDRIDDLQRAAKARRDALEGDLKVIEGERRGIPSDVDAILKGARATEKKAAARAAALEEAIPRERALLDELTEAERRRAELVQAGERLLVMTERIPTDDALAALSSQGEELQKLDRTAKAGVSAAEESHRSALSKHEELQAELGSEVELVEARNQVRARDAALKELARLQKQHKEELRARKAAAAVADRAARTAAEAVKSLAAVREEQANLQRLHSAHALRSGLEPGKPCPVCAQIVVEVPGGKAPPELSKVAVREEEAAVAERAAATEQQEAKLELKGWDTALARTAETIAAREEEEKSQEQELAAFFGAEIPSATTIDKRIEQLRTAADAVAAARARSAEEADRLRKVEEEMRLFEGTCLDHNHKLTEIFVGLGLAPPRLEGSAAAVTRDAARLRLALAERAEETQAALKGIDSDIMGVQTKLQKLRSKLALEPEDLIAFSFAQARAEAEVARNEAATAEKQLARAKELAHQEKEVKARRDLFATLTSDLTAQQFIAFLLEERTRLLLELGSERLHTMTSNRYRLELDSRNDLEVVDEFDADKRRSVDTLSGGETFLASLALAIALAEVVTRAGGSLQCFFLDEGFGTLDPESFDLAMDGIERIVTGGRLIGLVSHVPALRDRIEDQIILEKGEDGMSRVVTGAAR